jgi:coenzyme F420-reducing hydrogenase delta subunit
MPSPAVAFVVEKKKACVAAAASFENELKIVKAASDAVCYLHKYGHVEMTADWSEPMLTVWTFFQNLLEPDVRVSAASNKINETMSGLLGDWVNGGEYDPLDRKCEDQSVRGRCKAIVAAFYRAMKDMCDEIDCFARANKEEDSAYYPRLLWHQFWGNLEPNVRFAAYDIHEKYLADFTTEASKHLETFMSETYMSPDDSPFPDEISAKLSGNSDSEDESESDSDNDAPALLQRSASVCITGKKREALCESTSSKRYAKDIHVPPGTSIADIDINIVANAARKGMIKLLDMGCIVNNCDHQSGIVGQFWDEFLSCLPETITDRLDLAKESAEIYFEAECDN